MNGPTSPIPVLAEFKQAVAQRIDSHPIVQHNPYTSWFALGDATLMDLRDFTIQFSVSVISLLRLSCVNASIRLTSSATEQAKKFS
jgi:hypothetical protein